MSDAPMNDVLASDSPADPSRLLRLDGRLALVTGGARGIGAATCRLLARAGARVLVADIDGPAARALAEQIAAETRGPAAEGLHLDAADRAEIERAFAALAERGLALDILVNNAGTGARKASEDLAPEHWRRVLDLNLDGAFWACQCAACMMLPRGRGAIVNVASIMGLTGNDLYPNAAYHASKGALVNLTRALATEWAKRGLRVNAVAPTFAQTDLTERLLSDEALAAQILGRTPMGRLVEPEEVAQAILFLASDAAAMITGHSLPVDGGWMAQ